MITVMYTSYGLVIQFRTEKQHANRQAKLLLLLWFLLLLLGQAIPLIKSPPYYSQSQNIPRKGYGRVPETVEIKYCKWWIFRKRHFFCNQWLCIFHKNYKSLLVMYIWHPDIPLLTVIIIRITNLIIIIGPISLYVRISDVTQVMFHKVSRSIVVLLLS